MKRLLKKTFKELFSVSSVRKVSLSPRHRQFLLSASLSLSTLTAASVSWLGGIKPAQAFSLFNVPLDTYQAGNLNQSITVTDGLGGSAQVQFIITDTNGRLITNAPAGPANANSGFPVGNTLLLVFDSVNIADEIDVDINFLTAGNVPAEVERARLILTDIDRDNSNAWQDQVTIDPVADTTFTLPTTATPTPDLGVSPERPLTVPVAVEVGPGAPGLPNPGDHTVAPVPGLPNTFTGVYRSTQAIDNRINGTVDEQRPIEATPTGGVDVSPGAANRVAEEFEADNQLPEGTLNIDYAATQTEGIQSIGFQFQNGPASVSLANNGPGDAGFLQNNDLAPASRPDNGGPDRHAIGLYTVFFTPGVIGNAKIASTPVQVSATEFDVTYTILVQNYGARTTLSDVQVTDDLNATFGGSTGFTIVDGPSVTAGTLVENDNFDGVNDTNLLNGVGSLLPGASATIQYTVRLDTADPNIETGVEYNNTSVALGTTPVGLRIQDDSFFDTTAPNDLDPDPDDDGDPLERFPTPVTLPDPVLEPRINVSEQVEGTPEIAPADGTFGPGGANTARVTYRIRVENTGPERLEEVTLINDFTETFDNGSGGISGPDNGFEVISVAQVAGVANPANTATYDGGDTVDSGGPNTNNPILADGGVLDPGEFTEYLVVVDVDTTNNGETLTTTTPGVSPIPGTFFNSTTATGIGTDPTTPSNRPVADISNDGTGLDNLQDVLNPTGNSDTGGSLVGDPGQNPNDLIPLLPSTDDPANENTPTPVELQVATTTPQINVSEQVVDTVIEPTGTYGNDTGRVTYRIRVQNTGTEDLTNVTLTNDFTETFDNGSSAGDADPDNGFEIVSLEQVTGVGVVNPVNPNYDGGDTFDEQGTGPINTNDAELIQPGNLAVGEFSEYEIIVDVNLANNGETLNSPLPGPFDNFTTTNGTGVTSNTPVSDISNDATGLELEDQLNPLGGDPTGGSTIGNPGDPTAPDPDPNDSENTPTRVNFPVQPQINVSEQVVDTVLEPTGTYGDDTGRVTYRIRVQNTGVEDLTNVTLTNDFTETYDNGSGGDSGADNGFEIVSLEQVTGVGVVNPVNPSYDGGDTFDEQGAGPTNTNDAELIQPGNLAVGEFSEYEIVVDVNLANNGETLNSTLPGPFDNFTTTNGTGVTSNTPVSDISNDATGLELEDQLNPLGGDPTGGSTIGNPGDPTAPDPDPNDPENTPTRVNFPVQPQINVSEQVVSTVIDNTGTYGANTGRVTYRIRVQNTGVEDLTNVTLTNDFTETYDNGSGGDSGPDNGFEIVSLEQVAGVGVVNPINPNYDGGDTFDEQGAGPTNTNDAELIQPGNLAVGEFSEYEIVVDVNLANNGETLNSPLPGPFDNFTTANGTGVTSNSPVSDISNDATGADLEDQLNPPGGDPTGGGTVGDPGDPTSPTPNPADPENAPTIVNFVTQPLINVSEEVINTEVNPAGGTYGPTTGRVTYRIRVQNTGIEDLDTVTLTNDFTETFDNGSRGDSGPDNGFEIVSLQQVDGVGVVNPVNPNYDGGDTFDEQGAGPTNTNDAELIQPGSLAVGEFSEYEIVVDVNLANNGETLTTAIPGIFLNSTTTTGIGVDSNIPVSDISNDATGFTLFEALNPGNNSPNGGAEVGTPNQNPNTLAPNEDDLDNTPTPVTLTIDPQINVSEEVINSEINPTGGAFGNDTGRVTYRIRVQNTGAENLRDVTLINDFTGTFDDGSRGGSGPDNGFEIVSVTELIGGGQTSNPFNPNYDGGDSDNSNDVGPANTNNNILVSGGNLDVGQFSEYVIVVDVNLADNGETLISPLPGPFENSTLATGIGDDPIEPSNIPVSDRSNDRNSVTPLPADLEGALIPSDGSPTGGANIGAPGVEPSTLDPGTTDPANTPTPVLFGSDLKLVKRITRIIRGGSDLPIDRIDGFNDQGETDGDNDLFGLTNTSLPLGVFEIDTQLQSGDIIEYTIYFFNQGSSPATNIEMCDELQVPSVLQTNSLELSLPTPFGNGLNGNFGASGLLVPQAPLSPLVESCLSFPGNFPSGIPAGGLGVGAGGGVVAGGPTSGLTVNPNEVGAFRFTVVIP